MSDGHDVLDLKIRLVVVGALVVVGCDTVGCRLCGVLDRSVEPEGVVGDVGLAGEHLSVGRDADERGDGLFGRLPSEREQFSGSYPLLFGMLLMDEVFMSLAMPSRKSSLSGSIQLLIVRIVDVTKFHVWLKRYW